MGTEIRFGTKMTEEKMWNKGDAGDVELTGWRRRSGTKRAEEKMATKCTKEKLCN